MKSFSLLFVGLVIAAFPAARVKAQATNPAPVASAQASGEAGRVATLDTGDLREYEALSPQVQRLLASALALTKLDLSYKYGSSDPKEGGMDCSGTVYYLLKDAGLKDVPRDSSGMYKWVWTDSRFNAVTSSSLDSFEFARLKPGDLLFWTGTYSIERDPPITHVMIYLGINRHSGRRVMVGASEGRQFEGKSRYGVSVFDFVLPRKATAADAASGDLKARFVGYGAIPGLEETGSAQAPEK